jgi:hypothetical protein
MSRAYQNVHGISIRIGGGDTMSEVRPLAQASPNRHISGTRLKAANHLRFFHADDGSLTEVEFETHPLTKVLGVIFEALHHRKICIVDSATRITRSSLFQRLRLAEAGGAPLLGERRSDVEALFLEALSDLASQGPHEERMAVG